MSKVLLLIMLSILVNTVSGDEVLDRDHGIPGRNGDTAKTRIEIVSYQQRYVFISVKLSSKNVDQNQFINSYV